MYVYIYIYIHTDEVGGVVAVAEPSVWFAGARHVDAVVGHVCPGNVLPRQIVVVADVQRRVAEHVHRRRDLAQDVVTRRDAAGGGGGADDHKAKKKSSLRGQLVVPHGRRRSDRSLKSGSL